VATVQDILETKRPGVATITPHDTVSRAAKEMDRKSIGALVVNEKGKTVGIFSERDVLRRVLVQGLDPTKTPVEEVMTRPVACCYLGTALDECKAIMTVRHIRHLPVVDDGEVVGVITIGDLLANELTDEQENLREISRHTTPPQG
jgi:CBS domain-containing protein